MTTRLVAVGLLLATALIAWLTVTITLAARLLQAVAAISMLYVTYLAWRGGRAMRQQLGGEADPAAGEAAPWITVLVAARNEAAAIGALIGDLCRQQYPGRGERRFDVVVVDHGSTDGTGDVARTAGAELPGLVRVARVEFDGGPRTKGAALAAAREHVGGPVECVLDADARIAPDFLARAARAWAAQPAAAALQVQRRTWNAEQGWLPAAQDEELVMDMASQCGRAATGGTAELRGNGMFVRTEVLDRLGGWDPLALTEDLELSTRLAAAGEHVVQAPGARVEEEGIEGIGALWRQRMRWAEGSMRRLLDLGPRLVLGRHLPLGRRLDFVVFATEFVIPPLFVTTIVASLVTIPVPVPADWSVPATLALAYGVGTFLLAMAGLAAHGERGMRVFGRSLRGALFLSHWLVVIPWAIAWIALGPRTRAFVQTPRRPKR